MYVFQPNIIGGIESLATSIMLNLMRISLVNLSAAVNVELRLSAGSLVLLGINLSNALFLARTAPNIFLTLLLKFL